MLTDKEDIFRFFSRIKPLSYRQYKRLTNKEIEELNDLELYPQEKFYTMLLYKKLGKVKSIKRCSKWVNKHWDEYYDWCLTQKPKHFKFREKDLALEFSFRGFKEESSYHKRESYCYVLSNRMIDKIGYIYPERFVNNYNKMNKAKSINYAFPRIAIEGFTKILY